MVKCVNTEAAVSRFWPVQRLPEAGRQWLRAVEEDREGWRRRGPAPTPAPSPGAAYTRVGGVGQRFLPVCKVSVLICFTLRI